MQKATARFALALLTMAHTLACSNELDVVHSDAADFTAVFVAQSDDLLDDFGVDDDGAALTQAIAATGPVSRIGLRYDAVGDVGVEARVSSDGARTFGDWQTAAVTFTEGTAHNAAVDVDGAADTAGVTHLQLRFHAPTGSQLTFLAVDAFEPDLDAEEASGDAAPQSSSTQSLVGDLVSPRSAWGARSRSCPTTHTPRKLTIHHTETPANDTLSVAARIRQIQAYHIDVRGWCDIGYHFLVGADGSVYQGRRETTLGSHAGGANTDNVGIAFVGTFHTITPPPAMERAAAGLVSALSRAYGIALDRAHVKGHREVGSSGSNCPGDRLFGRLDGIIAAANAPAEPAPAEPAPAEPAPPAPTEPAPTTPAPTPVCTAAVVEGASSLNVRSAPDTNRAPVGSVNEGDRLTVTGVVDNGQDVGGIRRWYGITKASLQGYISARYARCTETSTTAPPAPTPPAVPPAPPAPTPTPGDVYSGLTLGTAEIPRAGLDNDTLQGALGVAVEPYGTAYSWGGHDWVRGRVSSFGGPDDTGVSSTETGAVTGERLRSLNAPMNASAATIASRPADFYYIAMRWDYTPNGRTFWRDARILVVNPDTGRRVVLRAVDWGPGTRTGRVLDISPQALEDLGATTDQNLLVAFATAGAALGVH